eukprot:342876_1
MYIDSCNRMSVMKSEFNDNIAHGDGGALYLDRSHDIMIDIAAFNNNSGRSGGAIYVLSSDRTDITNTSFKENKAMHDGGAIFSWFTDYLNVKNLLLRNNTAMNGGAIACMHGSCSGSMVTCIGNVGSKGGCVMYKNSVRNLLLNSCKFHDSIFVNNKAEYGGAIYWIASFNSLWMVNDTFVNNDANLGGAAYILGDAVIIDSNWSLNVAHREG